MVFFVWSMVFFRWGGEVRTLNLRNQNPMLYQLSYSPWFNLYTQNLEPVEQALKARKDSHNHQYETEK